MTPVTDKTDSVEEVSDEVLASAERVSDRYRINLDEADLRAWASDAVKVIRALSAALKKAGA